MEPWGQWAEGQGSQKEPGDHKGAQDHNGGWGLQWVLVTTMGPGNHNGSKVSLGGSKVSLHALGGPKPNGALGPKGWGGGGLGSQGATGPQWGPGP